jgi:plastocyanin
MQSPRRAGGLAALLLGAALAGHAACGGGGGSNPTTPTPPGAGGGSSSPTITINNNTVTPSEIVIAQGQRVLFVNQDSRAHDMSSDPHPEHTDCPEINQAGFLSPGQSRETGNFVTAKTCGFHDHNQPTVTTLRGRIVVR